MVKNIKKINLMQVMLTLDVGGAETFVVNLLKNINREIFNVSVCCIWKGGPLENELRKIDIPVYIMNKREGIDWSIFNKLKNIFKTNHIDVINTHHLGPLIYALIPAKIAKVKKIIHTEHSFKYFIKKRRYFWYAKILFKHVTKIIGVCDDITEYIKNNINKDSSKTLTIKNGIDVKKFNVIKTKEEILKIKSRLNLKKDSFIIGMVGRLDAVKNHKMTLKNFQKISLDNQNINLLIIGSGPEEKNIKQIIFNLKIQDKVILLGERTDISELLSIIDIFLLPSLSEGLSIALLEAMSSKKAIIASNVGGNIEIIKNNSNGLLFNLNSEEDFISTLLRLINNAELRHELGLKAFETVRGHFSLNCMVRKYENLYKV